MAPITVKIAGQKFRLAFTMDGLGMMQETVKDFNLGRLTELGRSPSALVSMLYVLAQQGEALEGRTLKQNRDWFGCHLSPSPKEAVRIQTAVFEALAQGLNMETEAEDDQEEVDEALEEIKKNGGKAASPGA